MEKVLENWVFISFVRCSYIIFLTLKCKNAIFTLNTYKDGIKYSKSLANFNLLNESYLSLSEEDIIKL